jgi:hypothetical protein
MNISRIILPTELPPVPIGYPGGDTVIAVAPDAILKGNVQFNNKHGWAGGWIMNWKNPNDSVIWPVEVYTSGIYEFSLKYICDESSTGTEMRLSVNNKQISGTISDPHTSGFIELPNVISELSPSVRESWGVLSLGRMKLHKGKYDIILQAVNIRGKSAGEFHALEIIKR